MKKNYTSHIIVWVITLVFGLFAWHVSAMWMWGTMDHSSISSHDAMNMSMADMWAMLDGKTWDELDKAFLEGMIPHHQGAIDMAEVLVDAKHPELREMGEEIIAAQQAEIDQMNTWLEQWWYNN